MSATDDNHEEHSNTTATDESTAGSATDVLAGFRAALLEAAETKPVGTADPLVSAAFALGWHMQELNARHPGDPRGLPSMSDLDDARRLKLTVSQLVHDLKAVEQSIEDAGLEPIDSSALKALATVAGKTDVVLALHDQLLIELSAADPRVGKAYGLGRSLADSCQRPKDLPSLKADLNPYRIANLLRWLDDLGSAFPAHAAESVLKSLSRWSDAIYPPRPDPSSGLWKPSDLWKKLKFRRQQRQLPNDLATSNPAALEKALYALNRQGELWRALLSGEKQGTDMLEIDNYLDAAKEFTRRFASTARRAVLRMKLLTLCVVALVGGGIWLLANGSSSHVVAGATSVLAALGLTWKGLGGVLGQLAGKLQRPLWDAVLDDVIADAITLLPDNRAESGGRLKVALALTTGLNERASQADRSVDPKS
jgi:hypothetical protein